MIPDFLCDADRFRLTRQRHLNALAWKPQGWIPLGITVNDPANTRGLTYDRWLEAEPFFEVQAKILRDTLAVGSDCMPVLPVNHLGDVLIPSMFGAELYVPKAMADSLQNQGATPLTLFDRIEQTDGLEVPAMSEGMMPQFERIVRTWHQLAPAWVDVITPFPIGPFSLAVELRGSDFFLDLVEDPRRSHRLLAVLAQTQIRTERHLRGCLGAEKVLPISNFGVFSTGRRLGDDSIIMLSPQMITEFAVPHLETIAGQLGPVTVHFCTLADRRTDQVFDPLAAAPGIAMASTQFGFEYYAEHLDALRGRLAVEAFYGGAHPYVCEKHGSFRDWALDFVPRFKNESGLILYFEVSDVETGKALWETWAEAHRR